MNLSRPFIRPGRHDAADVGVAIAGVLSFLLMPVAPLPQVEFPVHHGDCNLPAPARRRWRRRLQRPGAALGTIAGVNEITSSSSLSSTRVTLQFDLGKNIDSAAREVQAAINAARVTLPSSLPGNPVYRGKPGRFPVMILSLTSKSLHPGPDVRRCLHGPGAAHLADRRCWQRQCRRRRTAQRCVALDLPRVSAAGVSLEGCPRRYRQQQREPAEGGGRSWRPAVADWRANDQAKGRLNTCRWW